MAKRFKEPKTIDEARAIIIELLGQGRSIDFCAFWHDHNSGGRVTSSATYSCDVASAEDRYEKEFEAKGATPLELVRNVIKAYDELCKRRAAVHARQSDGTPRLTKKKPEPSLFG